MSNPPINKKYYSELFATKCLLTKLMEFLLDKDRCLAAGYTHYENYRREKGSFGHQIIILGYNRIEKENLKIGISYLLNKDPIYWIHATCIGDRPLKYMRSIIKTFCSGKETFAMKTIMNLSTALCVLINMRVVSNTIIDYEDDKFILNVLKNMRMTLDEMELFPTVMYDTANLNTFTLENLHMTDKVFNAIIEGITNNI